MKELTCLVIDTGYTFYKTAKWHSGEKSLRDNKRQKNNRWVFSVADHVMYIYVDDIFFFTIFVVQQPVKNLNEIYVWFLLHTNKI